MSKEVPEWRLLIPVSSCEKCGKAYSKAAFESGPINSELKIGDRQYRTWCKDCESELMDEGEQA